MTETDLEAIRLQLADKLRRRQRRSMDGGEPKGKAGAARRSVMVCGAGGCRSKQGRELYAALRDELIRKELGDRVELVQTGCLGVCGEGPILVVYPEGTVYTSVHISDVWEIVEDHLLADRPVERLLGGYLGAGPSEWPFFAGQTRAVTRRWGTINPERLEEAVGAGEYRALAEAVLRKKPADLSDLLKPFVSGADRADCLICSLNEAAPGLSIRQALAESDPHSLIEGMALAGYALGAACGYVHIPAEYGLAADRLRQAMQAAASAGLLGEGVLGSGFSFRLELCIGEEDFLQKEATALLEAMRGRRAAPRPGVSSESGRLTFEGGTAAVAAPESFVGFVTVAEEAWSLSESGCSSADTRFIALTGCVKQPGICEVSAGLTLNGLIGGIGGGTADGKPVQAVQYGGPAGGYLRPDQLDVPLTAAALRGWDEGMGAPELAVIGSGESLLDAVRSVYGFLGNQACGRCSTCRIGLERIREGLSLLTEDREDAALLAHLRELGGLLRETASCSFGRSAATPLLTYLDHFREAGKAVAK